MNSVAWVSSAVYCGGFGLNPSLASANAFQKTGKGKGGSGPALAKLTGFETRPPPSLTSITPAAGPAAGGTPVTLTGAQFATGAMVTLGGVAATEVQILSATELSALTGPHAAGAVDVVVSNADGQSATLSEAFTYLATAVDAGLDAGADGGRSDAGSTPDSGASPDGGTMGTMGTGGGGCASGGGGAASLLASLALACSALRRKRGGAGR